MDAARRAKAFLRTKLGPLWPPLTAAAWRVRTKVRPLQPPIFDQSRRLRDAPQASSAPAPRRVLFLTTRQHSDQLAYYVTLAHALRRKGHSITFLSCDRQIPSACNNGVYPRLHPAKCDVCATYASSYLATTGFPVRYVSEFAREDDRRAASQRLSTLDPAAYETFEHDGARLGESVRHSVAHFLRLGGTPLDPESRAAYRVWIENAVFLHEAWKRMLEELAPDAIVMLNGLFMPERVLFDLARARGIPVTTIEVGMRTETLVFRRNLPTDYEDDEAWAAWKDVPLTEDEDAALSQLLRAREVGKGYSVNYWPKLEERRDEVCRELAIDPTRRTATLFPNITWDSALFEKDIGYAGMLEWLLETIRFFERHPEWQLVVRAHPAEVILEGSLRDSVLKAIEREFPALPPNVRVVPPWSPISSYTLMDLSDVGLVYASTTGLEMAVRGRPVFVLGKVHYRAKGFTHDPATPSEYLKSLEDVCARGGRLDRASVELARRYAYFLFFRLSVPFHFVEFKRADDLPAFSEAGLAAIRGGDPGLDRLADAILGEAPAVARPP